jgi:hypothetical protein
MKIYQAVQNLFAGDTQTGDLISLLSFFESRLKVALGQDFLQGLWVSPVSIIPPWFSILHILLCSAYLHHGI